MTHFTRLLSKQRIRTIVLQVEIGDGIFGKTSFHVETLMTYGYSEVESRGTMGLIVC